jgi:hypothetical protein
VTYYGGPPLNEYLVARIDKRPDGCWLWTGSLMNPSASDSYGVATHRELPTRRTVAHRAVYEHEVGPIPAGLQLDHLCRVRCCVNPEHLEPVTQQENIARQPNIIAKKALTHCPQGHPYDDENTDLRTSGRRCRTCHRDRERARYQSRRAADPTWRKRAA